MPGIPFLSAGGESLLRFDIPDLKLHFLGRVLWIDEFHVFLLGTLFLLLLFLGATVVFGRAWCGWMCPQTVLPELAGWAASLFPAAWRGSARTALLLPLTGIVSLSLIWYFVPPAETARNLLSSRVLLGFFLAQWLVLFPLLAFAGVRFCRSVCPYAMPQNVLGFEGGATLLGDREITIPPRSRRAGKLLARRPGGAADRVVLVASAPGFVARKEVTFP